MAIYWTIFTISLIMLIVENIFVSSEERIKLNKSYIVKERWISLATLLPLIFFLSYRDEVLDTYAYINSYYRVPENWSELQKFVKNPFIKGIGFIYIEGIFKIFFHTTHYWWFFFLSTISIFCVYKTCIKRTPSMALSIYLFIAGAYFTWLLNGARQFLVISILFYASQLIIDNRKAWYLILIIILSYVHNSVIFLFPIIFFISPKILFGKRMVIVVIITLIGTYFSDSFLDSANEFMGGEYEEILEEEDTGSSIMRLFITCVTPLIALVNIKKINEVNTPSYIILGINMSIVGACFMFASTFTNGILIGRMAAYFTIYDLYLLPWLIYNCFSNTKQLIYPACIILYAILFYVQMCIAWKGLPYVSYALGISC